MKNIFGFLSSLAQNVWFGLKTCFLASKFYFSMKLVSLLFTTAVPLITIRLWREVLNSITDIASGGRRVILCLVLFLALELAEYLIDQLDNYVNDRYGDELTFYIERVMMDKTSRMDLSFFDSANMGDRVKHARSNFGVMEQMTWTIFGIISSLINVIATLIIVSCYKWWLGILSLALLAPYLFYNKKRTERKLAMEKEQIRDNRKMEYLKGIFYKSNVQFEIKLHGTGSYFHSKIEEIWQRLYSINKRESIRHNIINGSIMILNITGEVLVLIFSGIDVLAGKLGIGDLQYNLSMVSRLRRYSQSLISDINTFLADNTRILELRECEHENAQQAC